MSTAFDLPKPAPTTWPPSNTPPPPTNHHQILGPKVHLGTFLPPTPPPHQRTSTRYSVPRSTSERFSRLQLSGHKSPGPLPCPPSPIGPPCPSDAFPRIPAIRGRLKPVSSGSSAAPSVNNYLGAPVPHA